VKWLPEYRTDLLMVTLKKSEKRFSPSTPYRDYPISPDLFHWDVGDQVMGPPTTR